MCVGSKIHTKCLLTFILNVFLERFDGHAGFWPQFGAFNGASFASAIRFNSSAANRQPRCTSLLNAAGLRNDQLLIMQ